MKKFWAVFFIFWPIAALVLCVVAPQMKWWFYTMSGSPLGKEIDDLFYMINWITTLVFIGVNIALGYVLWTGADRPAGYRSSFTHGSHNLEVIWTVVPSGILLFIAMYQMDVWAQFRVQSSFPVEAREAPIAEVTARQFEWRIRYPAPGKKLMAKPQPDDIYTVNDLHVPAGKPVMIQLRTDDVQHAFFVPDLRVKQDAVPGLTIPVWFEVIKSGDYEWVCAELCGWGHYKMKARVSAQPEADHKAHMEQLQREQNDDGFRSGEAKPAIAEAK